MRSLKTELDINELEEEFLREKETNLGVAWFLIVVCIFLKLGNAIF